MDPLEAEERRRRAEADQEGLFDVPDTDIVEFDDDGDGDPKPASGQGTGEGPGAASDEVTDEVAQDQVEEESGKGKRKKKRLSLSSWVQSRAHTVVSKIYESRADDIEERARRAVGSAYRDSADDIQGRAVRAMRQAIADEGERIKQIIEHSVEVKKREVRLSLIVLVAASVIYLLLYWLTHDFGGAAS